MAGWRSPATAGPCSRASAASSCAAIRRRRGPAGKARAARTRRPRSPIRRAEALFQRLRQWRLQTARAQGVPPYVIFHDATLQAIAAARPRSRRDLEGLPGLGAAKLERYGDGACSRR